MITFYTGNAERPSPEALIGKLVGKEGVKSYQSYSLPLVVTGYTRNRIHTKPCMRRGDVFLPVKEWSGEDTVTMSPGRIFYVCDTLEEATSIVEACARAAEIHDDAMKVMNAEIKELFASVSDKSSRNVLA
ncbi:hypothetical protein G6L37_07035 [Agrobacterium rubi]|nr:hypothetical protein [Agrobacterium rubi]NTF25120.1 hypothetical protein [Agrobacterium rubi]